MRDAGLTRGSHYSCAGPIVRAEFFAAVRVKLNDITHEISRFFYSSRWTMNQTKEMMHQGSLKYGKNLDSGMPTTDSSEWKAIVSYFNAEFEKPENAGKRNTERKQLAEYFKVNLNAIRQRISCPDVVLSLSDQPRPMSSCRVHTLLDPCLSIVSSTPLVLCLWSLMRCSSSARLEHN